MDIDLMKYHPAGKFSQSSATTNYRLNTSEYSGLESSRERRATSIESVSPFHNPYMLNSSTPSVSFTGNPVQDSSNTNAELSFPNSLHQKRSMDAMREMIFGIAMMQPVHIDPESVKQPKRKNVKISQDPQSVAARHRRERISEKIRILQRLVPGGTKMDTASMLDEAAHYLKFLKRQVQSLEQTANGRPPNNAAIPITLAKSAMNYSQLFESLTVSA